MSFYDPLGFIDPIIARIKTIFALLCRNHYRLHENISSEIELIWNNFLDNLEKIELLRVKRFAFEQPKEIVFLDFFTWFFSPLFSRFLLVWFMLRAEKTFGISVLKLKELF